GTLTVCEGTEITNEMLFAQLGGADAGGIWSGPVDGVYTYTVEATGTCTEDATATVTVTVQNAIVVQSFDDQEACDNYTLANLNFGNQYFTFSGGAGIELFAGDSIEENQTIYVYAAASGSCPAAESSFEVTINDTPVAQSLEGEIACNSYILAELSEGNNYFTQSGGEGTELFAGDVITSTQTIYIYAETGNQVKCSDETSFKVTINPTPDVPVLDSTVNTTCNLNNGSIVLVAVDDVEFSIDGVNYQTNTLFSDLATGTYSVTSRFINGDCISASTEIEIIANPDTENPVLSEIENIVVDTDAGICGATVNYEVPTATDNCEGTEAILTEGLAPGSEFPVGTTIVEFTATDAAGNTVSTSFTVTVIDNEAPVADLDELPTVTGECAATVTVVPTATDNCGEIINGTTNDPLTYNEQGTYTITWTFDDGNDNISTQTQTVTVNDVTAPVADLDELPTVTGECAATVTAVPTATDSCEGTINGSTNDPLTYTEQGTYTITWTFNDGNENFSTQTQTVIVNDITAPVTDVAELPTVTGECAATVTAVPTATDSC
ncbi:MAG: HYR domain-containing protein, partial [Bacteroidota bacterium]